MEKTKKSKIRQMSNTNKIITIVSMSLIGLLILTAILLAVIPIYTLINLQNKPDQIEILYGTEHAIFAKESTGEEQQYYNKIWDAYTNSAKNSVMGAIFSGYAGKSADPHFSPSSMSFSGLSDTTSETFQIKFIWTEKQQMLNANGSEFKYKSSTTSNEVGQDFDTLNFAVPNKNEITYLTTYVQYYAGQTSSRFYYTSYNNLYDLNRMLMDMYKNNVFSPNN